MNDMNWLYRIKNDVLKFMEKIKSKRVPGFYKYSYSGDLYDDRIQWNVGSSVFALKIYYTLGIKKNEHINEICKYILSFKKPDGQIYDDLIYRKSILKNFFISALQMNFSNLLNKQYKRAETRQCYSSLMLYNHLPEDFTLEFPATQEKIGKYLSILNWNRPWGAGSHFSHLMFFYHLALNAGQINQEKYDTLTDFAIKWVERFHHSEDGCWYLGNVRNQIKINGAMKIITGLRVVNKLDFDYPEKLIDLCLITANDEQACDNFNIVMALNYSSKLLNRMYRQDEIEKFALNRLAIYKKHYYSELGGFSFFPNAANKDYYGARITRGLNEPDIHGTVLFLWGIAIISQVLGIEDELSLNEFMS